MELAPNQPTISQLTPSQLAQLELTLEGADEHFLESFAAEALAPDEFIAEGPAVVERAIHGGCKPRRLIVRNDELFLDDLQAFRTRFPHVPGRVATRERMAQLIGMNGLRGMLVVFERPTVASTDQLLATATRLLVLEHTSLPGMQGSFVRTAAALGFDGVLFGAGCVDPCARRELRASMGNLFFMPWSQSDLEGRVLMDALAQSGFTSVRLATKARSNAIPLGELGIGKSQRVALVIDMEDPSLASTEPTWADYATYIPTATERCLPLEKAAAIVMWKLFDRG